MHQNRHRTLAVFAVVVASLVSAAPAVATTTHIVRPVSTTSQTWTTAPFGADLASVLDDPVTRVDTPSTAGDYAQVNAMGMFDATVALAPPVLAGGETPTATRLLVYLQVGASTTVYLTLWVGQTVAATTTVPAGSPAGWYVTPAVALTSAQLARAYGHLRAVVGLGFTATRAYAMAAEVETNGEAAPPPGAGAPGSDLTGVPPLGGDLPPGDSPTTDGPKATRTGGARAAVAPILPDPATPLVLAQAESIVPVRVGCPAAAGDHCRGTIVLRVAGVPPRGRRAQTARCARGCRVIGQGRFDIAAGREKNVKVRIAKAARALFAGRSTLRATMVVTTRTASGRPNSTSRTVTLSRDT